MNRKHLCNVVIIVVVLSCILPTSSAEMPKLDFVSEKVGWKIIYSFSEYRAEPGDNVSFDIEIQSKEDNYDLRLWIDVNEPIIVEAKAQQSQLHFSELKTGDVKKESLEISIPESVEIGEIYSLNIRVQSHSNARGALNQRLPPPLDNPEYTYASIDDPSYAYSIQIEYYPELSINPDISIFTKGQTTTYKIIIKNTGSESADNVICQVNIPEEFDIIEGIEYIEVEEIEPNSNFDIIWKLKPRVEGNYNMRIVLDALNHKSIIQEVNLEVSSSLINILIIGVVIIIIIIALLFLFSRSY